MARDPLGIVIRQIRHLMGARQCRDGTDTDLLQRFATHREEAAFAELMRRHGPMVLSVCRRMSNNLDDADDAFQATFLVLVSKAGSIRKGESVGSWLHGVAFRIAREARIRADQRRMREMRGMNPTQSDPSTQAAGRELRMIIDEELDRLPVKYRSPLVLHYLEGKTKEETARQLGWTEGTVSGRLARARDLLRKRLSGRGLMLAGGTLAAALSEEGIAATVPTILAESTLEMATLFAAGQLAAGVNAARIAALTESVVKAMFLTKLKFAAAAVVLVLAAVGVGAAGLYQALADHPQVVQEQSRPAQLPPGPEGLAKGSAQVKKEGVIVRIPGSYTLAVALTADGKFLARGGADNTVDLWDVASGKKLHTLTGHTVPILRLAFSPDGKTLASITGTWLPDDVRGEVKLWDVATGKERVSVQGHPNRMLSLAFSRDGKTLATSSNTVKLWDVDTGKEKLELEFGKGILPWSLAFAPDGKTLATGTGGGIMGVMPSSVILWEVASGKERATIPGHGNSITWVGFAPDGKTFASASGPGANEAGQPLPGEIKLWDVVTAKERATIPIRLATPLQFFDLTFTADNQSLISATASFGVNEKEGGIAVQQWELATGKPRKTYWATFDTSGPPGAGTNAGVFFAALSADGKTVAWGGAEGNGSPFSPRRNQPITGTAHVWDVQSLASSPPRFPKEPERPASRNPLPEQAEGTFSLRLPAPATFIKPGERKTVALGIKRGKNFDEDVILTFTGTDVPRGVTFEPANPVIKHPGTEVEFAIQAAKDAAVGDFAIKVTGRTLKGNGFSNLFNLSVDPVGAAAEREHSGKPAMRRKYLRRSRDPFTGTFDFSIAADESAHDGKVLSIAGGKLVMKSKNGTEHSYTLAVNPQISYDNAACKLEDLRAGMIVRVTAKKDNPQAATRIEAVNHYGAFMAEYEEREPQSLPTSPPRKPSTEKQASPDPPEESQPPAIQAEQLFHRMEEKLAKAKTLECIFQLKSPRSGSVGVFSTEGALFLGEENRARLEIYEATKERPLQQLWVSNGTRWSMQSDVNAQPHLQNTPGNLNRAILTWLARLGLLATQGPVPVTDEKDFFTVSSFRLGNREKIGERETQRIEYQLSIKGQNEPISFTLWLDLKTGLPVKRTAGTEAPPGKFVTETYLKLKLDEKVDPEKFELPK